ncbi:MAG: hydantoinase/oxoprolinase family protein [Bacteroidota bacterium]
MKQYKIGIDVGGTNTDCVLVDQHNHIQTKAKLPTTPDISTGIEQAISKVLANSGVSSQEVQYVMLGTTHCTNAIVERKHLNKVGIIRVCKPASQMVPPLSGFPEDLKALTNQHIYMVHGGYEFDGRLIHPLNESELREVLQKMKGEVEAIAVTGIFSKINPAQEKRVAELAREIMGPAIPVSLSSQIGNLGLLERENSTILNALLQGIALNMVQSFQAAVMQNNVEAQLYMVQNDGTLMSLENARRFPVLTIACGPTNSIRGAGALSGVENGIVIDVGGTTSDAGVLVKQFPRESNKAAIVGGVQTNFRMPDVVSIGLGGGSLIDLQSDEIQIGPQSVGYRLPTEALCFGGEVFTLSDYAQYAEKLQIPTAHTGKELKELLKKKLAQDPEEIKEKIEAQIADMVYRLIDTVKTQSGEVPLILVGGGSPILPNRIKGVSEIIRPDHYEVANAYGACIAQIGGEAEKVFNLAQISRENAIEELKTEATQQAINSGARKESIEVLIVDDTPLAYLPNATKVKVKVCGDL